MNKWLDAWNTESHKEYKAKVFNIIDSYIDPPKTILDIGCGFARESELFQKKYKSKLWLLDGDFDTTKSISRDTKFGSAENFKFYNTIEILKESWNSRDMDYTFVDANDIRIDPSVKFDLILSSVSCGFHYPANTYKDLVEKHSHNDTKVIFDLRIGKEHPNVEIVHILHTKKGKHLKAQIKFV
jgi:SAM-dependent methyltransferase